MTTLAELLGLPMTAGSRDRRVGTDELGRAVMETPRGDRYVMTEQARPDLGEMAGEAVGAFRDDPLGATGNALAALAEGAWNGIEAPGNALRGEAQTYGDVADTALDWGVLSAAGTAPRGALRAGGLATDAAETPAQQVARLLRDGRASEVTDDLMAQVDPQEMARLYEGGMTGQAMPMDEASRMARAQEMGFDTGTPLYHGTTADVPAFDLARSGQVGEDFGPAVFTSTSPNIASGYAGQATGNADWRALVPDHEAALSEWGRAVVEHGSDAPQAIQAQSRAQVILDRMNAIQADVEAFRAPSDGGNVMPVMANTSAYPRYEGGGDHWFRVNSAAIDDARQSGAAGLRIEDVIDPATTPTAGIADTVISFNPTNTRSRFARFDPRLSHLANLSAGAAGAGIALPYLTDDERDLNALRTYLEAAQ